jgi:hypothetical protein
MHLVGLGLPGGGTATDVGLPQFRRRGLANVRVTRQLRIVPILPKRLDDAEDAMNCIRSSNVWLLIIFSCASFATHPTMNPSLIV